MRVAFIKSHIDKSLQWEWFSEELQKRGIHHIYIIIREYKPRIVDDLIDRNVKVYYLNHSGVSSFLINLYKIIRILIKEKINIIHTGLPYGNLIGVTAARLLKRNVITTIDNVSWADDYNNKRQKLIDRYVYKYANKIIVLTSLSKDYLLKKKYLPAEKIAVIGHSLKSCDYQNIASERLCVLKKGLEIKGDDFIIGMVARLEAWKGQQYVIEAMKDVVPQYPNVKLMIFGLDGPEAEPILSKIREYKLENNVFYKGFVQDTIALYRLFNIHVHVPINEIVETYGLGIIEGMISGCPQILTRSGISSYTIKHGINCIEVPYCSSEAIRDAIVKLIADPQLAKALGKQAKEDAIKLFDYTVKVDKHIDLYQKLKS